MINTMKFLEALWGFYSSVGKLWFEIFCRNDDGKVIVKFFDGVVASREASKWLEENLEKLNKERFHVYFGILPRDRKPEKGRGKAKDVSRGLWLWADLDYKASYDKLEDVPVSEDVKKLVEEQSYWYEELEDYALRAVYREGNKWVYVERPPLSKVIEEIKQKIGYEPTIVVDSGNGYHFYFKLIYEIDSKKLQKIEQSLVDILGADPQSKDLARVLRLPGSINPRINRVVEVILWNPGAEVDPDELLKRLEEARSRREEYTTYTISSKQLRELSDSEILEIKELLKEAYVPGQRQFLCLYLSGWAAKARIHPLSVAKIIKMLHEETNDTDRLQERLSTVVYSYKKAGLWSQEIEESMKQLLSQWGIERVSGLESLISEREIKGKSGLQEILEASLGEEKALEIIRRIEEIFGAASPFRDSIFELLDYEKQLYAVANLRKLIIVRARKTENGIKYKERIAPVAPTKVVVYINPLGGITKYEITFEGQTLRRPLVIGPAPLEDIVARLRAEGLVYHRRLVEDVLSALIQGYIRKGKAEIKEEIEAPGFYEINGEIHVVRWELREVSKEELREALMLLNELAGIWFEHVIDRFATVIKWGIVAPFSYIYKQKGRWIPWLYLYGASGTGKTTLGEILLHLWGLNLAQHKKSGGNIDTVPRLGHMLSQTSFPILVNEPGGAIHNENVVEVMKNAIESTIARGKHVRGTYIEIPALAPLIMASNKVLPRDDALLRRMIVIKFSYGEKIDEERQNEFNKVVKPRLDKLAALGYWIAKKILENPQVLEQDWRDLAVKLLEEAYREADLEIPQWIYLWYRTEEDVYEDMKEAIRSFLIKRINDEFAKHVGRVIVAVTDPTGNTQHRYLAREDTDLEQRVRIVLEKRYIPWIFLYNGNEVYITSQFVSEIKPLIGDIGGLKSIAELLGWEYNVFKRHGRTIRAIRVSLHDFIEFISSGFKVHEETFESQETSEQQALEHQTAQEAIAG